MDTASSEIICFFLNACVWERLVQVQEYLGVNTCVSADRATLASLTCTNRDPEV